MRWRGGRHGPLVGLAAAVVVSGMTPGRCFWLVRAGYAARMRLGNMEVRPLGGGMGCLAMVVGSIVLSVLCTLGANMLIR